MLKPSELARARSHVARFRPDTMIPLAKSIGPAQPGGRDDEYIPEDPCPCLIRPLSGKLTERLSLEELEGALSIKYAHDLNLTVSHRVRLGDADYQVKYVEPETAWRIEGVAILIPVRKNAG